MIYLCPASLVHSRHVGFTVHTNGSNTCNEPHITGMQSICCIFTQQSHMSSSSAKKCIRHARVQLYLIVWGGFLIGWLVCLFSLVLFVGVFSWEKPTLCDKLVILLKKKSVWHMGQNTTPRLCKRLEVSCSDTFQQYKARYRHTFKTNYLK